MWGPMVGGLSCSTSYAVMRWGKGDALVLDPCGAVTDTCPPRVGPGTSVVDVVVVPFGWLVKGVVSWVPPGASAELNRGSAARNQAVSWSR